ncbi:unnamed protein product, partial [Meganyctiphanes norvegica]
SPEGSKINIECPIFDLSREGCKKESITINERGRKKKNYCKRRRPPYTGKSNRVTVTHRRNKDTKNVQTKGYICRAFVITEDPATVDTTNNPTSMGPTVTQGPGNSPPATPSTSENTMVTTVNPFITTPQQTGGPITWFTPITTTAETVITWITLAPILKK